MRNRQQGMTMIGWLLVMIPIGIMVYAGIRLAPIYLNYYRVAQALRQLAVETKDDPAANVVAMRASLSKRFDVGYIDHPTAEQIEFHRVGAVWVATTDYEDLAPMFGNISLIVQFHKEVTLQ
jgi:hypothetical protein